MTLTDSNSKVPILLSWTVYCDETKYSTAGEHRLTAGTVKKVKTFKAPSHNRKRTTKALRYFFISPDSMKKENKTITTNHAMADYLWYCSQTSATNITMYKISTQQLTETHATKATTGMQYWRAVLVSKDHLRSNFEHNSINGSYQCDSSIVTHSKRW